jgi:hypothetical protein
MKTIYRAVLVILTTIGLAAFGQQAFAQTTPALEQSSGEVHVPLSQYTRLVANETKRAAPAGHALGVAQVRVVVSHRDGTAYARVEAKVSVRVLEDEWTLVPVLPAGVALESAQVGNRPVQLVFGPSGLAFSSDQAGEMQLTLRYGVQARRTDQGYALALPLPPSPSALINVELPGTGLDVAMVPGSALNVEERGGKTHARVSVPAGSSALVSWRTQAPRDYVLSRATYRGSAGADSIEWHGEFVVDVLTAAPFALPLIPASTTLGQVLVDDQPASVIEQAGQFAILFAGAGLRTVKVVFHTPIDTAIGPPGASVQIPRVPLTRFELRLPGKKELTVEPRANVELTEKDGDTLALVQVPLSDRVAFRWTEAVPAEVGEDVRATASLFTGIHAEEGVLYGRTTAVFEIARGETNTLTLQVPAGVHVDRVASPNGGIADWAVTDAANGARNVNIFLDRAVKGQYQVNVNFETVLGARGAQAPAVAVPLPSAEGVRRQRGMVALLASPELALVPVEEARLTRVGDNQLPAFFAGELQFPVAHTFKYAGESPALTVRAEAPVREQGKFDAQVDTLLSLGEVTLRGSSTISVQVKSGTIVALNLKLPKGVNVLGVTSPSLRSQDVTETDDAQQIELSFTQEMDGQFRVAVNYERITGDGTNEVPAPTLSVVGADVEHGRIAVEALAAVEVRTASVEQLSSLDVNELPRQLVLKTTNPILLAYKYVRATAPPRLVLRVERHEEIAVQQAAIERASYTTLFTRDGLAVTTARLDVRNSRRQFLRLVLPEGSQVWSVFVDGRPEKPARASAANDGGGHAVLIKLINSTAGFPVEIVYATQGEAMEGRGTVSGRLPSPDMVVTQTRWDVFLPVGLGYQRPDSNLELVVAGRPASPRAVMQPADGDASAPLRIDVPARGIHFAFEKLYANQGGEDPTVTVAYVDSALREWSQVAAWVGAVLVAIAVIGLATAVGRRPRMAVLAVVGAATMLTAMLVFTADPRGPIALLGATCVVLIIILGIKGLIAWRQRQSPWASESDVEYDERD